MLSRRQEIRHLNGRGTMAVINAQMHTRASRSSRRRRTHHSQHDSDEPDPETAADNASLVSNRDIHIDSGVNPTGLDDPVDFDMFAPEYSPPPQPRSGSVMSQQRLFQVDDILQDSSSESDSEEADNLPVGGGLSDFDDSDTDSLGGGSVEATHAPWLIGLSAADLLEEEFEAEALLRGMYKLLF